MAEDDGVTYEGASYRGSPKNKFVLTFKAIVMNQLSRITQLQSKEWKGGYWQERVDTLPNGLTTHSKIYIEDTREAFINSVGSLYDLLSRHFDKKMEEDYKDFEKELTKIKEKKVTNERAETFRILFRDLNKLMLRLRDLEIADMGDVDGDVEEGDVDFNGEVMDNFKTQEEKR